MKAILESADFNRLIESTKQFCAKRDTKPIHMWIRLEFSKDNNQVAAVSVDGFRMGIERATCCGMDEDFVAYIKPTAKKFPKKTQVEIERQDKKVFLSCNSEIIGFVQPDGEFLDWKKSYGKISEKDPDYKIGFNAEYMLNAMQSLKASCGDFLRTPVIFEIRDPLSPIVLKMGNNGERIVLPVRLKT